MSETARMANLVPGEVWAFAREHGVEAYVPAVLEAVRRHFPGADLRVIVEEDQEIADMRHIVVMLRERQMDVEQFLAANDAYHRCLFAVIPAPLICTFRLGLE